MDSVEYLGASGSMLSLNLYACCENNPIINFYNKNNLIKTMYEIKIDSLFNSNFDSCILVLKNKLTPHTLLPKGTPNSIGTQVDENGKIARERIWCRWKCCY